MEVSNVLGPGSLERVYHRALVEELRLRQIQVQSPYPIPVQYKGVSIGNYVADLVVEERMLLELKALAALAPEHEAQLLNYLKATGLRVGLLINFGTPRLQWKRMVR